MSEKCPRCGVIVPDASYLIGNDFEKERTILGHLIGGDDCDRIADLCRQLQEAQAQTEYERRAALQMADSFAVGVADLRRQVAHAKEVNLKLTDAIAEQYDRAEKAKESSDGANQAD